MMSETENLLLFCHDRALFQKRTADLIPFFSILGYGMGMSGGFGDY